MLPNLVIIGAMKCGTSALHHYLGLHPDIFMSRQKELDFFIEDRNWRHGIEWYSSMFPQPAAIRGESSPDYTHYPALPGVPERMHALIPDAQLIYMVRDPIERMLSQYMHNRWTGLETRPFEQAIHGTHGEGMEHSRYVRRSKYYMQAEQFLRYYPQSRLLILTQEDLHERRRETLRRVFRFLGVDETFDTDGFDTLVHESRGKDTRNWLGIALSRGPERGLLRRLPAGVRQPLERAVRSVTTGTVKRPVLDESLRRQIVSVLAPDIAQFEALAGRHFAEWSTSEMVPA